jgi:arsenate reductase
MPTLMAVCPGNAGRSILAEAILRARGAGRIRALSAGTNPVGAVHPAAREALEAAGISAAGLRSTGIAEIAAPAAPPLDLVIALCPQAMAELPARLPGRPARVLWALPDPLSAPPGQVALACRTCRDRLAVRIERLLALPLEGMPREALAAAIAEDATA